ncbi:unannotated protein [freshwater metagenome]|uniref:pantoate--beta-alanine ligase (AMP-forming) n=1 Tax=freshwater metagenome TaxID=449393 RepID=A0A6J7FCP1_9ZZZZ
MHVLTTLAQLRSWRTQHAGKTVAFVPTMGALHDGHISLVERAREAADLVVVSVFVNPTQFGQGEDFDNYPRTLDADATKLAGLADVVFAPTVDEVYPPDEPPPVIHAGSGGQAFEGAERPGHFDGMLTVVNRLFDMVAPNVAVFGQKDAQQLHLVRVLARDRGGPEILAVHTVREPDGLAMSSRNRFLSAENRAAARVMPETVQAVVAARAEGPVKALRRGRAVMAAQPLARLDYLELVSPKDFSPVGEDFHGEATLVVAARFGSTRLLDTEDIFVP